MSDIRIELPSFGKNVLVSVPDADDLTEIFNETAAFIGMLEAHNKIRDLDKGINPAQATHEIIKEKNDYRLQRFRFC